MILVRQWMILKNICKMNILMDLPFFHRDPFDRIIIAQAIMENLTIMTDDEYIKQYSLNII